MLRVLVLLLVLANGLYYAWSHEQLRAYGFGPAPQREPQRIFQQVQPDAVRILSSEEVRAVEQPASAASAASAGARAAECLLAGPLNDTRAEAMRQALTGVLPEGSWTVEAVTTPARWIVYLGRFPDAQALARKRSELQSLGLRAEPVSTGALAPGLSLGGYDSETRAKAELAAFGRRGVRTASVVQERPEARTQWLRLPSADEAVRSRVDPVLSPWPDVAFKACSN